MEFWFFIFSANLTFHIYNMLEKYVRRLLSWEMHTESRFVAAVGIVAGSMHAHWEPRTGSRTMAVVIEES
jgi:hypothetical protein